MLQGLECKLKAGSEEHVGWLALERDGNMTLIPEKGKTSGGQTSTLHHNDQDHVQIDSRKIICSHC